MERVDLQRLVDIIVEELAAAARTPPRRCDCHALLYECCPDRLRGVIEAGATRLGIHATGGAAAGVASMIDHTLLKPDATRRDIEAVSAPCREIGALSKVIIEAALLTDEEKIAACTVAKAAGADFVKTSTGFGPGGATVADVALMRRVVGAEMGVKAAGGVRDLEGLQAMVAAGATRIGASAGVRIVQESRGEKPVPASKGY